MNKRPKLPALTLWSLYSNGTGREEAEREIRNKHNEELYGTYRLRQSKEVNYIVHKKIIIRGERKAMMG